MTLEDLHALAATAKGQGRVLKRRLTLLQPILTRMPASATNAFIRTKRYNREFWTNFLTPCTAMELADWQFDLLHDAHNNLVEDILVGLDKIVQVAEANISEEHKATRFPRLETLSRAIREASKTDDFLIELVKPDNADEFLELLNRLANIMTYTNDPLPLPEPEPIKTSSKRKPLLAPLIYNLFSTLSLYWRCTSRCRNSHKAALALFTNRAYSSDDDLSASFTVLLSKPNTTNSMIQWVETGITVRNPLAKPKADQAARLTLPEINLCEIIEQRNPSRVNLIVDGKSLLCHSQTDIEMAVFQEYEPVSFTKGFLENSSRLAFDGKICLAVVLSLSFLDFCGKPWFPGGWNKNNLYLMQDGLSLSLRPFLITEMKPREKELFVKATVAIWEAKLLDHGILLMEIFQQDGFREPLKRPGKGPPTLKERKKLARAWFNSINWDVYERWYHAVKVCIDGTIIDMFNMTSISAVQESPQLVPAESLNENFAGLFHKAIISPLEADFALVWSKESPDQVISTLKLPCTTKVLKSSSNPQGTRSGGETSADVVPLTEMQTQDKSPAVANAIINTEIEDTRTLVTQQDQAAERRGC